jgi:hypothetical protein
MMVFDGELEYVWTSDEEKWVTVGGRRLLDMLLFMGYNEKTLQEHLNVKIIIEVND